MSVPLENQMTLTAASEHNPMAMLATAVSKGVDTAQLEKLLELQQRWEAGEARKAYTDAMAKFKADPPRIVKDKLVSFETQKGRTQYKHATLGSVCAAIIAGLAEHRISHRWETDQVSEKPNIKVTCILTHAQGHSEQVSMSGPADTSGTKNPIQAIGSAITYLQRYTLLSITGLATTEQDDDGRGATKREPHNPDERFDDRDEAPADSLDWQQFYPDAWQDEELKGKRLGDLDDADLGALWKSNVRCEPLCAWAAWWVDYSLEKHLPSLNWEALGRQIGAPAEITQCSPEQLWLAAMAVRKAKASAGGAA